MSQDVNLGIINSIVQAVQREKNKANMERERSREYTPCDLRVKKKNDEMGCWDQRVEKEGQTETERD